jgi:hypothetical protein
MWLPMSCGVFISSEIPIYPWRSGWDMKRLSLWSAHPGLNKASYFSGVGCSIEGPVAILNRYGVLISCLRAGHVKAHS